MARSSFGGTSMDVVVVKDRIAGKDYVRLTSASLTCWDAATGGNRHTDLMQNGEPVSAVAVPDDGFIPQFLGPDGIQTLWIEGPTGERRLMVTTDGAIDLSTQLSTRIPTSEKGAPGGVATLDGFGDIPVDQVPGLPASKVTSEQFHPDRIPALPASKVTSGQFDVARIPDLSGIHPRVEDVPTLEDLLFSNTISWRHPSSSSDTLQLPASSCHGVVMVAPYPLTILSASILFTRGQAVDATNYWTAALRRSAGGTTSGDDIASFTTSGGNTALEPTEWAQLDPAFVQLAVGDLLLVAMTRSTTSSPQLGAGIVTVRYART